MGLGFWDVVGAAFQGFFLSCLLTGLLLPLATFVVVTVPDIRLGNIADLKVSDVFGTIFMSVMIVGVVFGGALIFALPGFVILRSLLYLAKVQSPLGFALAGATNVVAILVILASVELRQLIVSFAGKDRFLTVVWLTVGALAGLMCRRVEARYLGAASAAPSGISPPAEAGS